MGSAFILPLLQLLLEISSQTPSWGAGLPPGWQCTSAAPPPHPPWLSSLQFHSQLLFLYLNPSPWQGIQTCQEGSPVLLFPTTNTSGRFVPAPYPHQLPIFGLGGKQHSCHFWGIVIPTTGSFIKPKGKKSLGSDAAARAKCVLDLLLCGRERNISRLVLTC